MSNLMHFKNKIINLFFLQKETFRSESVKLLCLELQNSVGEYQGFQEQLFYLLKYVLTNRNQYYKLTVDLFK